MASFYIVPKIGIGTKESPFEPKYFMDLKATRVSGGSDLLFSLGDFGLDPQFIVGLTDQSATTTLTAGEKTFLASQGDVIVVPPLNDLVGGNPTLNQTQNRIEALGIPGNWIVATTPWRDVLGNVARGCLIRQRLHSRHNGKLFGPGVTMNRTLTQELLDQLVSVGQSFGLDTSMLSLTTTVRDAQMALISQLPQYHLAGETF